MLLHPPPFTEQLSNFSTGSAVSLICWLFFLFRAVSPRDSEQSPMDEHLQSVIGQTARYRAALRLAHCGCSLCFVVVMIDFIGVQAKQKNH